MKAAHVKLITDAGGRIYEVGGAVRDRLIGEAEGIAVEPKDRDFVVTGIPMDDLEALLRTIGHVDLVGKSFGVLKFRPDGKDEVLDIALPRKEKSTGEGHRDFEVEFDHTLDIRDDLGRRDFTVNAVADDLETGELIDPFDGLKAIQDKRIHIVFPEAFEEDPLRMLRAVQFAARFKFRLTDETIRSIRKHAEKIETISGERVYEELKKIMLKAEFPSIAFKLMKTTGLLKLLLPELQATVGVTQPAKFHNQDVFGHIMAAVDSTPSTKLKVRLAALFHDIAKPQTRTEIDGAIHFYQHEHVAIPVVKRILRRLRAPEDVVEDVARLVGNHMFEATFDMSRRAIRRLIRRVGEELIYDLIDLRVGDRIASGKPFLGMGRVGRLREIVAKELAEPVFDLKHLKLDGHDLIEMDFKPGPQFKEILRDLLEQVMDDPGLNEKDKLKEIVREKYGKDSN